MFELPKLGQLLSSFSSLTADAPAEQPEIASMISPLSIPDAFEPPPPLTEKPPPVIDLASALSAAFTPNTPSFGTLSPATATPGEFSLSTTPPTSFPSFNIPFPHYEKEAPTPSSSPGFLDPNSSCDDDKGGSLKPMTNCGGD